jgi:hypothetical protein
MRRLLFTLAIIPLVLVIATHAQAQPEEEIIAPIAYDESFSPTPVEISTRSHDSSLTQLFQSEFGYTFMLPAKAKFNPIGSSINKPGATQTANYILPGGAGSIKIWNLKERQVVPPGYKMLDSMIYYDIDSVGVNGKIRTRTYILHFMAVRMQVLLTPKGEPEYADRLKAIFDSFTPPATAGKILERWRFEYGKDHGGESIENY